MLLVCFLPLHVNELFKLLLRTSFLPILFYSQVENSTVIVTGEHEPGIG
jgi:hypothetical protein